MTDATCTRRTMTLIGADLICALAALSAVIWAASTADLFALAVTSAFFGNSIAFAWADWRYMRRLADLERRLDQIEARYRDRNVGNG